MKINDSLISKLESLSRLELTRDEKAVIKTDLEDILKMVEKLQSLDTTDVEPLRYLTKEHQPPREDIPASMNIREKALNLSPKRHNDFIAIPKVIDKK